jgi:AraC family transcriptional regulator
LYSETHPFLKPFPQRSYRQITKCETENILALRPTEYLTGLKLFNSDYVFTISNVTPPPILVDGKEYQFQKSRLIVYPPGVFIQTTVSGPADNYTCINMKASYLEDIAKQVTGRPSVFKRLQNPCSTSLAASVQRFFNEFDAYSDNCPLMIQSLSTELAIEILRSTGVAGRDNKARPGARERAVEIARDYIHSYYSADISLDDICTVLSLNRYYFIRLFKEHTGMTPYRYLITYRLEKARELLNKKSCSIEEAAALCGFVSASHFISSFRKAYGMTPGQYREIRSMK